MVLVTQLIDDSGSIRFVVGNTEAVRTGHNTVIDALTKSKQSNGILIHTRYLNGEILFPYRVLKDAVKMDSHNYNPDGGTPLYDQTAVILGTVTVKTQEFLDAQVAVRTITLIVTDGHDQHSFRHDAHSIKPTVIDMLKSERHIIAVMGIDDTPDTCPNCRYNLKSHIETNGTLPDENCPGCQHKVRTDFVKVFTEMGIQQNWILTPKNSEKEIRAAFNLFSQSAVTASQGGGSFSQTAIGGFGQQP